MENGIFFIIVFSGVFGIVGLVFAAIGFSILRSSKYYKQNCTEKTKAKIIDIAESSDENGVSWYPVYEYTIDDLTYKKQSKYGSSTVNYAIGQDIELYYNPNNPHEFYNPEDKTGNSMAIIFSALGSLFILISVVAIICYSVAGSKLNEFINNKNYSNTIINEEINENSNYGNIDLHDYEIEY